MSDAEVSPGFRIKTYPAPDTIPADYICRVLRIPNDLSIIAAVSDVLAYLSRPFTWEAASETEEIQMRALMAQMVYTYFYGDCDDPMIGELRLFVVSILPSNVLPCDGSTYNQGDYPTLAAVLPAVYKDDVEGTFVTPDFRGRVPVGVGLGDGLTERAIGNSGGSERVALTESELPEHIHKLEGVSQDYPLLHADGEGESVVLAGYQLTDLETSTVGEGATHENMPPFHVVKIGIVAR